MAPIGDGDQRDEHKTDPIEEVSAEELARVGVLYWHIEPAPEADGYEPAELKRIREQRGYVSSDIIRVAKETLPNYEEKIRGFFEEHLHVDEEIRYVVDGTGYFDVRDGDERWVRIALSRGDLIVLPAGIYHRFTLDRGNRIVAVRLFLEEPVWTPYPRTADGTDGLPARRAYVEETLGAGKAATKRSQGDAGLEPSGREEKKSATA